MLRHALPRPSSKISAKIQNPRTKTPILCSKFPKTGVPKGKKHKNPDFVLETPENRGFEGQKSTKTQILCSKCPKMRVSKAKSAQKPRFCARNARKWGSGGQKSTKTPILCSGRRESGIEREEIGIGKHNRGLPANHRARFQNANTS